MERDFDVILMIWGHINMLSSSKEHINSIKLNCNLLFYEDLSKDYSHRKV